MDAVKNDVKRLVKIELAAANKKFRMFAGPHEGAGIIQEEVVEAVQEMNGLRQELNAMWMNVYSNNPQISTKGVYDRAVALAVEAIWNLKEPAAPAAGMRATPGYASTAILRTVPTSLTRRTPASAGKSERKKTASATTK